MPESFGARLRQRREERGISLIAIAEQTKIKPSLLDALEQDDVSHWPSGIYRRAFIRAYAHAIDLDPDIVVREFQEVHPEPPGVDVVAAIASVLDGDRGNARSTTRLRDVVGSAIGSLSRLRPVASRPAPETVQPSSAPDLLAVARLCTEFGRARNTTEAQLLLQDAARMLDARGVIVWRWDRSAARLKPALVHGYSEKVIAQLPLVRREANNATAAAFRSAQTLTIAGSEHSSGALVAPMLTAEGCAGVLAIELRHGAEQLEPTRAVANILAALLAHVTDGVGASTLGSPGDRCPDVVVSAL